MPHFNMAIFLLICQAFCRYLTFIFFRGHCQDSNYDSLKLDILFQDESLVAINKPPGLLVHRTRIAEERKYFALQLLRNQIGQRVYPAHRLDRKTSGILLFAKNKEAGAILAERFRSRSVRKIYYAIVRGYIEENQLIDYELKKAKLGLAQEAKTHYKRLAQVQIDIPVGPYQQSRYSLAEVQPLTGRMHQIRRHFAHIRHPIVGDRPHGDWRHNKMFKETLGIPHMLLHASSLQFQHPFKTQVIQLRAPLFDSFEKALATFGWQIPKEENLKNLLQERTAIRSRYLQSRYPLQFTPYLLVHAQATRSLRRLRAPVAWHSPQQLRGSFSFLSGLF